MVEKKIPLSITILAQDEEEMLPDCLSSVSFADDIVVVDSGSTDRTVEIAEAMGAKVFFRKWDGEGKQRSFALDKCRYDWVLVLDADERLPEETRALVPEYIGSEKADAYSFPRKNFLNGKWIKRAGWWPDREVRLFRKSKARYDDTIIHKTLRITGNVESSPSPIVHYPVRNLSQVIAKINRYSSLGAEELLKKGRRSSAITPVIKGMAAFIKLYVIKLGVLDGYEGFVISFCHGVNTCFKYLKLREANQRK
jgi:glycosyltransferase involved in cell wall biosynthesis